MIPVDIPIGMVEIKKNLIKKLRLNCLHSLKSLSFIRGQHVIIMALNRRIIIPRAITTRIFRLTCPSPFIAYRDSYPAN